MTALRTASPAPATVEEPLSRRGLSRGLLAGLAVVAVAPAIEAPAAEAAYGRNHARVCKHWHRCKKHKAHTCRHLHRCKHRFHKAPRSQPTQPTTPTQPTPTNPSPTGPGPMDPGPLDPTPTDPAPTDPAPTDPAPSDPAPTDPAPTDPAPTDPAPTEPAPTDPAPTDPTGPVVDPVFVASPLPTAESLHLGTRFSYAMTPALHQQMRDAGSPQAWFAQQLDPASIPDAAADDLSTWWTSIDLDYAAIWQRDRAQTEGGWQAMENYARWCLVRRIYSRRQVLEVMTEFWENHLHVPVYDDGVFTYRAQYGKLIRSHALGRYDEMLVAAITHPAMGISLDNAGSTKQAPNENLGRELLELHTIGRGNYGEDDVKASARILTGYRVDSWRTWNATYDPASHWTGAVKVAGFSHANTSPDGRAVAQEYLTYLARHPKTAERLARKLAIQFVSDTPSAALVAHLAQVYLDSSTAIKPVLLALVAHPEFKASAGQKVRTPTDDVIATHRVLDTKIARPTWYGSTANVILWQTADIGHSPFAWGRPDGPPQDNRSWSSASRVLASFASHYSMSGRWWPQEQMTYRTFESWLPTSGMRFDAFVDHLCTQLLGKRAPARLVQAAAAATQTGVAEPMTTTHAVLRWKMPILLTTLLDTPDHMQR
ncbi:DUF1800 family protein [Nocardioides sp.]|uniref:DUF1800 family protein n=1 Tax=Nocardioides sp. TaxID=35761 RepID=UPI002728A740|nr:DUF1800 family protein [Nocardioides sp.]MDO9457719.1 DUF1800 family protein [Nocardioides sp.]